MDGRDFLLAQAIVVLGGMAVLALLKRRTRKSGLDQYVRRHSPRSRWRPIGRDPGPRR